MQLDLFEDVLAESEGIGDTILCRKCQVEKTHDNFIPSLIKYLKEDRKYKQNSCPAATGTSAYCKECSSSYRRGKKIAYLNAPPKPKSDYPCHCCNTVVPKGKLHMDHDHHDYQFRGWLCRQCNVSIGGLGDDIKGLENAISYLRNHYERS